VTAVTDPVNGSMTEDDRDASDVTSPIDETGDFENP
jgi:hypothetical protein